MAEFQRRAESKDVLLLSVSVWRGDWWGGFHSIEDKLSYNELHGQWETRRVIHSHVKDYGTLNAGAKNDPGLMARASGKPRVMELWVGNFSSLVQVGGFKTESPCQSASKMELQKNTEGRLSGVIFPITGIISRKFSELQFPTWVTQTESHSPRALTGTQSPNCIPQSSLLWWTVYSW